ncbi:MAG: L-arabinose isomerase, partial [Candidatus Neomarinimicrobiota bacterium]
MKALNNYEVWFVTGSQHLYGEEVLKQVSDHSRKMADFLNDASIIPVRVIFKTVLTDPAAIYKLSLEANNAEKCIGLITWMHTFSPSKM